MINAFKTPRDRGVIRIEGRRKAAVEALRQRIVMVMVLTVFAFAALAVRLVDLTLLQNINRSGDIALLPEPVSPPRADILDRNGVVLARSIPSYTLAARPARVRDVAGTSQRVSQILPELSPSYVAEKLSSRRVFTRIKRHITPRQHYLLNAIGEPGLEFEAESKRIYPNGNLAAHALGFVNGDGEGQMGIEKFRDASLRFDAKTNTPLRLTLDVRVQHALEDELLRAIARHRAIGGAGIMLDIESGEVLALVSLPDFDPNAVAKSPKNFQYNRATMGTYELGSVFKMFTVANGLDSGVARMTSHYDATKPLRVGGYLIHDDHPELRWLSLPELMTHSSNIAAGQLALQIGAERQRNFMDDLGLLTRASLEIDELGQPKFSARWGETETVTTSYGHGLSVSLLHLAQASAPILNGGTLIRATLIANDNAVAPGPRVLSQSTSKAMRQLLRLVVTDGTGRNADVVGYRLGGKTGTAEKPGARGYRKDANITSFLGAFPMEAPRYVVVVMLDEPKGLANAPHLNAAAWNAAPVVKNVVARVAPMLGVLPGDQDIELEPLRLAMRASYTP